MKTSAELMSLTILNTLDALQLPAFFADEEGIISSINATFSETFQYIMPEVAGLHLRMILSPDTGLTRKNCIPVEEGLSTGRGFRERATEVLCMKKNGDVFTAQATCLLVDDGKKIIALQDISDRKKLIERAAQRTKELSVFNAFALILNSHKEKNALFRETLSMLLGHMNANRGWIYIYDEEAGDMYPAMLSGFAQEEVDVAQRLLPGESLSGKVFSSGRALLVKDASSDPRVKFKHLGFGSMIAVPVVSMGRTLGVIGIASPQRDFFTSMDTQLLSTIGSQLGVAIENISLISTLHEKMRLIELTNELSGIINSSLSIGTVFRMVAHEIRNLVGYDRASLLLYDEEADSLLIFALDTEMKTLMKKGIRAPVEGTSAGWVAINNKPWINRDLSRSEFSLDKKLYDEGIRSTVSIPLYYDRMLGVFSLDSTTVEAYSEEDLNVLLPIAKHISVALENALLFEEISKEKKEWEKTFDAITDMMWIEDGQQSVLRANQALLMKTGLSPFQITGKHSKEILTRIGVSPGDCLCIGTISSQKPSFREVRGAGGSTFHYWAYPLLDDEGRMYAVVHYMKDMTARKQLEQQLVRADRLASLGTLVAGIAHEINNPLGIIAGYSDALRDRARDRNLLDMKEFEDFPEYLSTIHGEIFRCKDILKGLLDFARPSGSTFREIDINELIKEVILLINHRAKKLDHRIELKLNRDLPRLHADPGGLRQMFMNIIFNSLYFTPAGGTISISSRMHRQTDEESTVSPSIDILIEDSGPGIPEDIAERIFDPFFTTKPVGEGTGLGLSISHRIVEEHGGTIEASNSGEGGAVFRITLPLEVAQ